MGDININKGQAAAIGREANVHDNTFNQLWSKAIESVDLPTLATELTTLREHLKQKTSKPSHDVAIGAIASAEVSAKDGDGPKTLEWLAKAGQWALDNSTKIGIPVATEALKKALGL